MDHAVALDFSSSTVLLVAAKDSMAEGKARLWDLNAGKSSKDTTCTLAAIAMFCV
jgi:hypothetical protein